MKLLERHHLKCQRKDQELDLWRLEDAEFRYLRQHSWPLQGTLVGSLWEFWKEADDPDRLTVLQAFLALEHLFGESSDWVDDWKGSFSFPLLMQLTKQSESSFYLLEIYDHQGEIYFAFYKLSENPLTSDESSYLRKPEEVGFSSEEMNKIISYIKGYLEAVFQVAQGSFTDCFLRKIRSELTLYGCEEGKLFEKRFSSSEEYQEALANFQEKNKAELQSQQKRKLQETLQQIRQES